MLFGTVGQTVIMAHRNHFVSVDDCATDLVLDVAFFGFFQQDGGNVHGNV
jgi:hypothetical protein